MSYPSTLRELADHVRAGNGAIDPAAVANVARNRIVRDITENLRLGIPVDHWKIEADQRAFCWLVAKSARRQIAYEAELATLTPAEREARRVAMHAELAASAIPPRPTMRVAS